jgi:hypothetical protein
MWKLQYDGTITGGYPNPRPEVMGVLNGSATADYLPDTIMKTLEPSIIGNFFIDNLSVEIVREANYYICSDSYSCIYGTGESISEAISSYKYILIDFYKFLKNKNSQQLDEVYLRDLEYLEKVVAPM